MSTQSRFGSDATPFERIAPVAPERIDRYRIIRLLGEGGMGVVYLAEQDEPVRREVAIKVLRAGSDSAEVVARFASERQALALMEHPNITRVFDAGLTATGLPYFVMERVEGDPINEYAAARRLTTRARAALFVQVCRAVQHAHQKGIIHRDLKPSNVLVSSTDGAPVCKVIDFGIAKATGPANIGARLTATGMAVGTPAYMSPEQFLGHDADVDTRTDIYSLGVLLYELLAGTLPGAVGDTPSWGALLRRAEGDLPSASAQFEALSPETRATYAAERGTDPEGMRRSLRGDLDSILTKALDLDRDRRYATAAAFADDLEHFLADEPISARGASRAYRVRKFVQRHRAGVVLSALLLVVLVATAVGASVQAQRLAVARTAAQQRQHQAEDLLKFMLGDLTTKLRPIGRLDVMDDVDRKLLAYFAAVPVTMLSDDERLSRSEALYQLGSIRMEQGRLPEADTLMSASVAMATSLAMRPAALPSWKLQLALSEYGAGNIAWQTGHIDEALKHFLPFVRISEQLTAQFPDSVEYRAQRAYALNNIGLAMQRKGDAAAALKNYRDSRDLLKPLAASTPANVTWQKALSIALNSTAEAERRVGDLNGALADHQEELAIRERLVAADTADPDLLRLAANSRAFLGDTHAWRGEMAAAVADLSAASQMLRTVVAHDTVNPTWGLNYLSTSRRLGQALAERGDARSALAAFAHSREAMARLPAAFAGNDKSRRELAILDGASAQALLRVGRTAEALATARRAASATDSAMSRHPEDVERRVATGDVALALGDALRQSGDSAAAVMIWTRALALGTVPMPLAAETDLLMLRVAALLRLGRPADASADAAELIRRGVRRPAFLGLLRAHGLPTGS